MVGGGGRTGDGDGRLHEMLIEMCTVGLGGLPSFVLGEGQPLVAATVGTPFSWILWLSGGRILSCICSPFREFPSFGMVEGQG